MGYRVPAHPVPGFFGKGRGNLIVVLLETLNRNEHRGLITAGPIGAR